MVLAKKKVRKHGTALAAKHGTALAAQKVRPTEADNFLIVNNMTRLRDLPFKAECADTDDAILKQYVEWVIANSKDPTEKVDVKTKLYTRRCKHFCRATCAGCGETIVVCGEDPCSPPGGGNDLWHWDCFQQHKVNVKKEHLRQRRQRYKEKAPENNAWRRHLYRVAKGKTKGTIDKLLDDLCEID